MKRLHIILVGLLCWAILPVNMVQTAHAQESLPTEDIDRISQSVVLIGTLDRRGNLIGTGSGTIVTASGLIYTNSHVIEDGRDFEIYILDDPNELPVHRYYAQLIEDYRELDFAILQIDRLSNGREINTSTLNLPYLEPQAAEVSRGDRIYAFGYPGIGDGYLVLTNGTITTIQNGQVAGQRMPIWYQTDAELSPGNSGGLAVNTQGQVVGIPTAVSSERETGGRLGGILPMSAVLALIGSGSGTRAPSVVEGSSPDDTPRTNQSLQIEITDVEVDIEYQGQRGLFVYAYIAASGYQNVPLRSAVFFYWQNDSPVTTTASDYRTPSGHLTVQEVITPSFSASEWQNYWFFVPNAALPAELLAGREAYVVADLGVDGETFVATSNAYRFAADEPSVTESNPPSSPGSGFRDGVSATCDNGTRIEGGVEILISQMRPGFSYTATVLGINNSDPILMVRAENEAIIATRCSDDATGAAQYTADLPTTRRVNSASTNAQLQFSHNNRDLQDISLVIGGYNSVPGEYLVILEGMAATAADGLGDPFVVDITQDMIDSGVPLTVYMIGRETQLDPFVVVYDVFADGVMQDRRGDFVYCDDAGTDICWGTSGTLSGSQISTGSRTITADELDAMLRLPLNTLDEDLLVFLMTSYEQATNGQYIIAFHFATG